MIRPKSEAELHQQLMEVPRVGYGNGSDMSEEGRYTNIRNGYIAILVTGNDDPQRVSNSLEATYKEMADSGLLNARGPRHGFPAAIRNAARRHDEHFSNTLQAFKERSSVDGPEYETAKRQLQERTLDLTNGNVDRELAVELFPSGNWLLHSSSTEGIIGILENGSLLSTAGLIKQDPRNMAKSVGGSFGVSWNFNSSRTLIGDSRHLAGFMADPQTILKTQGGILAIPQKSCFDEVQYFKTDPDDIDRIRRTELLYRSAMGIQNTYALAMAWLTGPSAVRALVGGDTKLAEEASKKIEELARFIKAEGQDAPELRKNYIVFPKSGDLAFSSVSADIDHSRLFLTFLQAVADHNIKGLPEQLYPFDKVPNGLDIAWMRDMEPAFHQFMKNFDATMTRVGNEIGVQSSVNIENMIFYCPKKDYPFWLETLARAQKQPLGVVVYDGSKIRVPSGFQDGELENFGRDELAKVMNDASNLPDQEKLRWNQFFENGETPKRSSIAHYTIDGRQAANAGVMILDDNGKPVIKSLDELDEDD